MPKLRIVADYSCWPIWDEEGEMNEPSDYPLSQETIDGLNQWQAKMDATLDLDIGQNSGFKSKQEWEAFQAEGRELALRMQQELGDEYEIWYHNERVQIPVAV
jgi:hypothetical protein